MPIVPKCHGQAVATDGETIVMEFIDPFFYGTVTEGHDSGEMTIGN